MGRVDAAELSDPPRPPSRVAIGLGVGALVAAAGGILLALIPALRGGGIGCGVLAMGLGIAALRVAPRRDPTGVAGLVSGVVAVLLALALLVAATLAPSTPPTASASPTLSGTPTPSPTPTPTAAFPEFAPSTVSGRNSADVPVPAGATAGLVTAVFRGAGYFTVGGIDAAGTSSGDDLVNLYGSSYSGTTFYSGTTLSALRVRGDGTWTITVAPVSSAPALGATASGSGDAVLRLDADAGAWDVTSGGSGLFTLQQRGASETTLLASATGPYSGGVETASGASLIIVHADGAWTLTRR